MKLRQTAALACMFCMPMEPPDDFEEKVVEKITLKQKLAQDWWLKNRETVFSQTESFEAGFEKARDLAAKEFENSLIKYEGFEFKQAFKAIRQDLENIGEEMVDE